MQKLKAANLYRSELIPISGKLVERYNKCLLKLGFSETKLSKFSIDGIGWSPEIAEERNNQYYLNNGEANLHGILISPLQKGKPVYFPFHSFDKDIMTQVFRVHGSKILDITRDCAICIDFDQNIDAFYEPLDVLKYKNISINFHLINDLDKAQKKQLELIRTFKKDINFINETLQKELLESAKKYGDLRKRNLDLHQLSYKASSFYTKAFGGIYVLRDFNSHIVVFEKEESYKEAIKDTFHDVLIFHISQPELMDKLRDHTIIQYDLKKEVKSEKYERVKKYFFSQHLNEIEHPIKDILNDNLLFKSYLNKMDISARKKVMCVEIYLEKLAINNQFKIDMIDKVILDALHSPHVSLKAEHQDLIQQLLINIAPIDVLFLYWYDKEEFYKQYEIWEDSMKDWVIETIHKNIKFYV